MYKIGDYIIYNKDVCKIRNVLKKIYNDIDYYELESKKDNSLKIKVRVDSTKIRPIIKKSEIEKIINDIPNIESIKENDRLIENSYKTLMKSGTHEDLIKIIKTTYERNKKRIDENKKVSEIDDTYFKQAEKYLYNEFGTVLNKTFEETKEYVKKEVLKHIS